MALSAVSTRWDASRIPCLDGKVVVITGANAGIGFATASAMAARGAHVILGCRSRERGLEAERSIREQTGSATVDFMQLDMSSLTSIRAFSDAVHLKFDRLDILVNNAGVMHPPEAKTVDGFEAHFGVNHLGHFYLTHLLFDLLKHATDEARVVTVSSTNHRYVATDTDFASLGHDKSGRKYMNEYSVSKLCNLLFTYELDRRLKAAKGTNEKKIKTVGCHPGITLTNIIPSAMNLHVLPSFIQAAFHKVIVALPIFQTPEVGALPSLCAATETSVESGDFIGPDGYRSFWGYPKKDTSSPLSHSLEAAVQLWKRSEELLHVSFTV